MQEALAAAHTSNRVNAEAAEAQRHELELEKLRLASLLIAGDQPAVIRRKSSVQLVSSTIGAELQARPHFLRQTAQRSV